MEILLQLLMIAITLSSFAMIGVMMWMIRRSGIKDPDLILWDLLILFVPFGWLVALIYLMSKKSR